MTFTPMRLLIDEAVAGVPQHRLRTRCCAGDFRFLELALAGICLQVKRIVHPHCAAVVVR